MKEYVQTVRLADLTESQVTALCLALDRSLEQYRANPPHYVLAEAEPNSCIANQMLVLTALRDAQHGRHNPMVKSIMVKNAGEPQLREGRREVPS